MCPCAIPDAEAHGKDSNICPEQLYLSNGDVSLCSFSFLSCFPYVQIYFVPLAPHCPEPDFYSSGSGTGQQLVYTVFYLISVAAVCDFL